jgi:hypothetical protein
MCVRIVKKFNYSTGFGYLEAINLFSQKSWQARTKALENHDENSLI